MLTVRVDNLKSPQTGRPVANQYVVDNATLELPEDTFTGRAFQSYNTTIAFHARECRNTGNIDRTFLDRQYWDYSVTTIKYLREFLQVSNVSTIREKIESGEFELIDLNGEGHQA